MTQLQLLRDTTLYSRAVDAYTYAQKQKEDLPALADVATVDPSWIEKTNTRNNSEKTKLEVELKTYASNMIKESIRVSFFVYENGGLGSSEDADCECSCALDGSTRSGIVQSVYRELQRSTTTLHQIPRILHLKSTHPRHDNLYS